MFLRTPEEGSSEPVKRTPEAKTAQNFGCFFTPFFSPDYVLPSRLLPLTRFYENSHHHYQRQQPRAFNNHYSMPTNISSAMSSPEEGLDADGVTHSTEGVTQAVRSQAERPPERSATPRPLHRRNQDERGARGTLPIHEEEGSEIH